MEIITASISRAVRDAARLPDVLADIVAHYVRDPTFLHPSDYLHGAYITVELVDGRQVEVGRMRMVMWQVWIYDLPALGGWMCHQTCLDDLCGLITGESTEAVGPLADDWPMISAQLYDKIKVRSAKRAKNERGTGDSPDDGP